MSMSLMHSDMLFVVVVCILCLNVGVVTVECSHFAFATILWSQQSASNGSQSFTPSGNYVINVNSAFRTDYAGWPNVPYVGDLLSVGNLEFFDMGANSAPSNTNPPHIVCSGYYTPPNTATLSRALYVTVNYLYPYDWFSASSAESIALTKGHNYYYAWCECCRIETLTDGNGGSSSTPYQVTGFIAGAYQFSPFSTAFPRQYFTVNRQNIFKFPIVLNNPSATISSVVESTAAFSEVHYLFGIGTTVGAAVSKQLNATKGDSWTSTGPSAGMLVWTPATTGIYALQVRVTESTGIYITVDIMFQVEAACVSGSGCNTVNVTAPSNVTFFPGFATSFNVQAVSSTDSSVTITTTVLPAGATFTKVSQSGGTAVYVLSWTPGTDAVSTTVCFAGAGADGGLSDGDQCTQLQVILHTTTTTLPTTATPNTTTTAATFPTLTSSTTPTLPSTTASGATVSATTEAQTSTTVTVAPTPGPTTSTATTVTPPTTPSPSSTTGYINITFSNENPTAFIPICMNSVWGLYGVTLNVWLTLGVFGGQTYSTVSLTSLLTNAQGEAITMSVAFYLNGTASPFSTSEIFNVVNSETNGNVWSFQLKDWESAIGANFIFSNGTDSVTTCNLESQPPAITVAISIDEQFVVGKGSPYGNIPAVSAFPTIINQLSQNLQVVET